MQPREPSPVQDTLHREHQERRARLAMPASARKERPWRPIIEVVHSIQEIRPFDPDRPRARIFVSEIVEATAARYGVTVVDILSARRGAQIVRARQIAMWLARHLTLLSFPQIGHRFGDKDHSSIIHACDKIDAALANPAFKTEVQSLRRKIIAAAERRVLA